MRGDGSDSKDPAVNQAADPSARVGEVGRADADVIDVDVIDVEVLPAKRGTIATERGRTFGADGHVESHPWRPFSGEGPPVHVASDAGCAPGLLRWMGYALGAVLLVVAALALLRGSGMTTTEAVSWLRASGAVGRVALVALVVVVTPLFVPSGLMAVLPGYLWGTVEGTALILIGAALGGLLNMWLARRVLDRRIAAIVNAAPMLGILRETIRVRGFRIALALRMSPVTPYSMLAYLAGVAGLSYGRFTLASVLGGIPWTSVYAMAGALLASTAQELRLGEQPELGPETVWLRWLGLGFTVAVAVWIGRAARNDLARVRRETSGLQ